VIGQQPQQQEASNPTDINKIPQSRKSAEFKTKKQLINDIYYFFKNYKLVLQDEIQLMPKMKTTAQLKELHNRIVGKLSTSEMDEPEKQEGPRLFINAEDYINNRIRQLIAEHGLDGLAPVDFVDLNKQPDDTTNVGSYTLKKNKAGLAVANRAPVFRSIPTTRPTPPQKKHIHLKTMPTQEWSKANVANRLSLDNPFIKKVHVNRIIL
jgi:hypothetical protein